MSPEIRGWLGGLWGTENFCWLRCVYWKLSHFSWNKRTLHCFVWVYCYLGQCFSSDGTWSWLGGLRGTENNNFIND
jgi:hypothetical protein